jgi:hypothetical protein
MLIAGAIEELETFRRRMGWMVEIKRTETVGRDGMVHIAIPELAPGQLVQIVVREEPAKKYRRAGGLEGKITIADDFDAPLPQMEPYS